MEENLKYNLLRIIKYNSNVIELVNKGYEYGQIILFIKELEKEDYLENINNLFELTKKGFIFINDYEVKNDIEKYSEWLLIREEKWKKPIKVDDYFPW